MEALKMSPARPRTRWVLWLLLAGSAVAAAPPGGSSFEAADSFARTLALTDDSGSRQVPFAGFTSYDSLKKEWTVVTFYSMFREAADGEARRRDTYWIARRVTGSDVRTARTRPEAAWTSSDKCPALDTKIRSMGDVIADRLELAVAGEGEPSEIEADPTRYRLWTEQGRFRGTGFAASLSIASSAASPIGAWAQSSAAALDGCWAGAPPPGAPAAAP